MAAAAAAAAGPRRLVRCQSSGSTGPGSGVQADRAAGTGAPAHTEDSQEQQQQQQVPPPAADENAVSAAIGEATSIVHQAFPQLPHAEPRLEPQHPAVDGSAAEPDDPGSPAAKRNRESAMLAAADCPSAGAGSTGSAAAADCDDEATEQDHRRWLFCRLLIKSAVLQLPVVLVGAPCVLLVAALCVLLVAALCVLLVAAPCLLLRARHCLAAAAAAAGGRQQAAEEQQKGDTASRAARAPPGSAAGRLRPARADSPSSRQSASEGTAGAPGLTPAGWAAGGNAVQEMTAPQQGVGSRQLVGGGGSLLTSPRVVSAADQPRNSFIDLTTV